MRVLGLGALGALERLQGVERPLARHRADAGAPLPLRLGHGHLRREPPDRIATEAETPNSPQRRRIRPPPLRSPEQAIAPTPSEALGHQALGRLGVVGHRGPAILGKGAEQPAAALAKRALVAPL